MTLAHDPNDVCGYWFLNTGTKEELLAACGWHDKAYTEESWAQKNLSRKEVDLWFYNQMLIIAGDNTLRRIKAKAFYLVARLFGGLLWEGKNENNTNNVNTRLFRLCNEKSGCVREKPTCFS